MSKNKPKTDKKKNKKKDEKLARVISYMTLRRAIGLLGIAFPVILVIGSVVVGGYNEIQQSISFYYHTNMRDFFVGLLCVVAFFLFAYKGYGDIDYIFAKLGCLFALGTAWFPTAHYNPMVSTLHYVSAVLLFLVLAFFAIRLFTLSKDNTGTFKERWEE